MLLGEAEPFHTAIVPYIPLLVAVISTIGVGAFALWNRRRGAVESKQPSVSQLWEEDRKKEAELDLERSMRRWFETAFFDLRRAFRAYVDRVHESGSTTLKPFEQKALEAVPPNLDKEEAP